MDYIEAARRSLMGELSWIPVRICNYPTAGSREQPCCISEAIGVIDAALHEVASLVRVLAGCSRNG